MIDFIHLHVHTTYSMLDGYGTPEQYFDRLDEIGHDTFAITDHGNIWAHIPFEKEAKQRNKNVIFGCEFYIVEDSTKRESRTRYHITVLAKNKTGLVNIHKLTSYANLEGFYYKPRIDFNTLLKYKAGLIVLSGCMGDGVVIQNLNNHDFLHNYLTTFKKEMGRDFYVEVSPIADAVGYKPDIQGVIDKADEYNVPIISTSDTHFPSPSDYSGEDLSLCIGLKTTHDDPNRMKLMKELYMFDGIEAEKRGKAVYGQRFEEAFANTLEIKQKTNAIHPKSHRMKYRYEKKENGNYSLASENNEDLFREIIQKGIEKRKLKTQPRWAEYEQRLQREMTTIIEKKFVDYFLIIWDMVNWAHKRMLVGPARGSVAGSLVAYCMNITQVDPIKHNLMFERFIDVSRTDDPDIDIDFPDEKRKLIFEYMVNKYGQQHTSQLGSLGKFKSKNALWDTRRVYDLPWNECKELAGMVLERSSGDARAQFCLSDSFKEFERAQEILRKYPQFAYAEKLEGQIRQTGVHAAAVVVSEDELELFGGFQEGSQDEIILQLDKHGAKYLQLLKIDVLGLKQLGVFELVLDMIGKDPEWLYNLPLDDEDSYQLLKDGKYWGIFQFEGDAVRFTCQQTRPDTFLNLSEISALARPGALHSGGTTDYIDRRAYVKGFTDRPTAKKPEYLHPLLKEIAEETYGIIIYQEQVMKIMRDIGNMTWSETSTARLGMSKSMGVEYFAQLKKSFMEGASKNSIPAGDAEVLWDSMQHFGSWAFNKSHSISYGLISYWCLYLKAHYPNEFYVATLQKEQDENIQKKILREFVEGGGKLVPFDFNKSGVTFTLKDGVIYGGWANLKGIGEKAAEKLAGMAPWKNSKDFRKAANKKALQVLKSINQLPADLPVGGNQYSLFTGDIETENWGDIQPDPELTKETIMPWADLYPIGDKYVSAFKNKGYNITYAKDIGELTKKVIMIVKVMDIQICSKREETSHNPSKQNYRDKHLDRYLKLQTEDDTESILMGVSRYLYDAIGLELIRSGIGSVMVIKGNKIPGFRKIQIQKMKILKQGTNNE